MLILHSMSKYIRQSMQNMPLFFMVDNLRNKIGQDIFDYQMLTDALKEYSSPRDKISRLMKSGEIIQLRKGLYIFGESHRKAPVSKELIANILYGPSYVSYEYALSYYGIIPEKVTVVTSASIGRSRKFDTPFGLFTYQMMPHKVFSIGLDKISSFLIATPEKALADKVASDSNLNIKSVKAMTEYLISSLRADVTSVDLAEMNAIAKVYGMSKISLLSEALERLKSE